MEGSNNVSMRFEADGLRYKITDTEKHLVNVCGLTKGNKSAPEISIPAKVSFEGTEYEVKSIEAKAFAEDGNH